MTQNTENESIPELGPCIVCGGMIDMEDGEGLRVYENETVEAHEKHGITVEDINESMANALDREGGEANEMAARGFRDPETEPVFHESCWLQTALPDFPTYDGENE
jgi:hypothetical protein